MIKPRNPKRNLGYKEVLREKRNTRRAPSNTKGSRVCLGEDAAASLPLCDDLCLLGRGWETGKVLIDWWSSKIVCFYTSDTKKEETQGLPFLSIQCFLKAKRGKGPAQKGPRARQAHLHRDRLFARGCTVTGAGARAAWPEGSGATSARGGREARVSLPRGPWGTLWPRHQRRPKSLMALTLGQSTQILLTTLKNSKCLWCQVRNTLCSRQEGGEMQKRLL